MNELVVFDPVKAELAEYKKENLELGFDYEDPQGNKDARSHIYKLRQAKTKIADIHKVAKAEALGICRLLDGEKKKLTAEVEEMIDVHYKPVKEIEERAVKAAAVKANEERLEAIRIEAERTAERERREEELVAKEAVVKEKEDALVREQEKLEAAKQAEVDKQVALGEARASAERRRIAAREQAEQDKKDAAELAEREKQAAVEAEKERQRKEADAIQVELDKQREVDAERIADEKHIARVDTEIRQALFALTEDYEASDVILAALVKDEIPYVTIQY